MALLDGDQQEFFYNAFVGNYLDGMLTKIEKNLATDGDVSDTRTDHPVKLHRNPIGEIARQEFADIDICLIILRYQIPDITTNDEVTFENIRYAVRRTESDPAAIYWKVWGERVSNDEA